MDFSRQRRLPPVLPVATSFSSDDAEYTVENARASRERLVMAVNHMTAFVLIFYGLYAICRFGFGWDPTRDPPPPSYTINIPGLTHVQPAVNLRDPP